MDKKDKTMEFSPVNDERKERISRSENSVYSNARKSAYESKKNYSDKSSDSRGMLYVVIALLCAIIIAVVIGAIIISQGKKPAQMPPALEEKQEQIIEEEQEVKTEAIYNIIFYGETVKKVGDGYTIAADLYDESYEIVGSRKITINDETVIRESGKRMSTEGFIYTVESLTGDMISIEGKIREKDNFAISLSYDGAFREELEREEIIESEEVTENQVPETGEPTPTENESENIESKENEQQSPIQ